MTWLFPWCLNNAGPKHKYVFVVPNLYYLASILASSLLALLDLSEIKQMLYTAIILMNE